MPSTPRRARWGLLYLALATLGAAPPPPGPADAAVTDAATADDLGAAPTPEPCVLDATAAARAVSDAYAQLARIHRSRVPGPRGASILERAVDAWTSGLIDVDAFAHKVLRQNWELATAEQRTAWRDALEHVLRRRYLRVYDAPTEHALEVLRSDVACTTASVRVALTPRRRGATGRTLELDLVLVSGGWRVYDVTVDGASLARTWRARFQRIEREGGLDAIDAELRTLAARYRVAPDDAPDP